MFESFIVDLILVPILALAKAVGFSLSLYCITYQLTSCVYIHSRKSKFDKNLSFAEDVRLF